MKKLVLFLALLLGVGFAAAFAAEPVETSVRAETLAQTTAEKSTIEAQIIGFLTNPFVSAVLIMLIIGGIFLEMQSPGIGFALGVFIVAALLYFVPLYMSGLASSWEILAFFVGILFLALEVFVIPGFGVCGVLGVLCMASSLTLALLDNNGLSFENLPPSRVLVALVVVFTSLMLSIPLCFFLSKKILTANSKTARFISLNTEQKQEDGYVAVDLNLHKPLIGKEAVAATVLRPAGKIEVEGNIYDAVCENNFVEKGEKLKIIAFENAQFVVKRL